MLTTTQLGAVIPIALKQNQTTKDTILKTLDHLEQEVWSSINLNSYNSFNNEYDFIRYCLDTVQEIDERFRNV